MTNTPSLPALHRARYDELADPYFALLNYLYEQSLGGTKEVALDLAAISSATNLSKVAVEMCLELLADYLTITEQQTIVLKQDKLYIC